MEPIETVPVSQSPGPFAAGQRWTYRAPAGFEASRIVIGAVVSCGTGERVVCVSVAGAAGRQADGSWAPVVIPFLPFAEHAFAATVVRQDGSDVPPPEFAAALEAWVGDGRGLSQFTIPFEGSMDRLIAQQMAAIVGPEAEQALSRP